MVLRPPSRGLIYDRNGYVLVENRIRWSIKADLLALQPEIHRKYLALIKAERVRGAPVEFDKLQDKARLDVLQGWLDRVWYVIDDGGWRNSGLYHWNGTPRLTYGALRTFAQMIRNTTYLSTGSGYPDTHEAFVLRRSSNEHVHVVWSKTVDPAAVTAPAAKVIAAYDMNGNVLPPNGTSGTDEFWNVGIDPIYIVRQP